MSEESAQNRIATALESIDQRLGVIHGLLERLLAQQANVAEPEGVVEDRWVGLSDLKDFAAAIQEKTRNDFAQKLWTIMVKQIIPDTMSRTLRVRLDGVEIRGTSSGALESRQGHVELEVASLKKLVPTLCRTDYRNLGVMTYDLLVGWANSL